MRTPAEVALALAERLRTLRAQRGLTQEALAARAQLSRAYLAALERGHHSATKAPPRPSRAVLLRLASALELPPQELLQPTLPAPPVTVSEAPPCWGEAPGAVGTPEPWAWPAAEGVVRVSAAGAGLVAGDVVLVRQWRGDEVPEGLSLLERQGAWSWGRLALIQGRTYLEAEDGAYHPLTGAWRPVARALGIWRALSLD